LLICQLLAQNVVRTALLLVLTAQAEPLIVPRSTAPSCGAVQETLGAASALSGIAPQTASAARAIGVLWNCINVSPLEVGKCEARGRSFLRALR
jgi:hypothetical protein